MKNQIKETKRLISRREFLQYTVMGGAAAYLAACAPVVQNTGG